MNVSVTANYDGTGNSYVGAVSDTSLEAVLFSFNPTADSRVAYIKALCAALISVMEPIKTRTAAIAITDIETAQMRAVKALFAK